jgi:general secretion pathway protein E/type IV pilus assembly protein PilB
MDAGEILVSRGLINRQQLELARGRDSATVLDAAIELGYVSEENALRAVGDAVGLDYVDLTGEEDEDELRRLVESFPQKLIYRQTLFPIRRSNGTLVVATADPFDLYPLDEVSAATGLSVIPVLAGRGEIDKLIKKYLGVGSETVEGLIAAADDEDEVQLLEDIETDGSELSEMAQEASVVRLVNEILLEAIEVRASDVHIE